MSNCMWLTVHVRFRWVISQKPTRQAVFAYFLPSWRWFCFFSHITRDCKAKQTKSVSSPPRLYQSVSTCTSSYQTMGRWFAIRTHLRTSHRIETESPSNNFNISERHLGTLLHCEQTVWIQSWETRGTLRRNSKARVHLAPFAEPLAPFFWGFFSTVPNEETAYVPACGRLQEDALHPASFVTELVSLWAQTPQAVRDVLG